MCLTVLDLKDLILSLPDDYKGVGIDSVNSWRGSYAEPSFTIGESTKKDMLAIIDECVSKCFIGYKDGEFFEFFYDYGSPVSFDGYGNYTDGGYLYSAILENKHSEFIKGLLKTITKP